MGIDALDARPSFLDYQERFRRHKHVRGSWDRNGAPWMLPVWYGKRDLLMYDFDTLLSINSTAQLSNQPAGCVGPPARMMGRGVLKRHRGKFACGRPMVCLWCWHRRKWTQAVLGVRRFHGIENTYKISVNLPSADTPEMAIEARKSLGKMLKKIGATRYWLFIHMTGDVVTEGIKFGIDGLVAGPGFLGKKINDAATVSDWWKPLDKYQTRDGKVLTGRRGYSRKLSGQIKQLIHAAGYAGRCTYDVRRMVAGSYRTQFGFAVVNYGLNPKDPVRYMQPKVWEWEEWVCKHENIAKVWKKVQRVHAHGPRYAGRAADLMVTMNMRNVLSYGLGRSIGELDWGTR